MSSLCAHLIAGKAVAADATGATPVYNPSRGEVIAQAPAGTAAEVGHAVEAARKALPGWAETPVVERARILFRYKALLEEQFESLARLVTREHGKTLEEARGDVRRGIRRAILQHSVAHHGTGSGQRGARHRRPGVDGAGGCLCGNHPVQLSRHGSDVDVPAGNRLRQHLCVETLPQSS